MARAPACHRRNDDDTRELGSGGAVASDERQTHILDVVHGWRRRLERSWYDVLLEPNWNFVLPRRRY